MQALGIAGANQWLRRACHNFVVTRECKPDASGQALTARRPNQRSEGIASNPDAVHEEALIVQPPQSARRVDLGRPVYCLFGLTFDAVTLDEAVERLHHCAAMRVPYLVSTPNVNFVVAAQTDAAFRDSVLRSDLSLADGMPIVWAARLMGVPIRRRVAGSDLFERLRNRKGHRLKVYFFGGPPGAAERASGVLNVERIGLECVGFQSPGFGSVEDLSDATRIGCINSSGADFLVVALGAKKGQAWIEHNRPSLLPPIVSHLGAVVNFVAGHLRRAPQAWQRAGLEWCWRILQEPGLWRRYLHDGTVLLRLIVTRVVPCAVSLQLHRVLAAPEVAARYEAVVDHRATIFRLHGSWTSRSLGCLRTDIARHLQSGSTVEIDLSCATWVDGALIGLAILLDTWQVQPRAIVPGSASHAAVRTIFRWHGADFLLGR